MNVNTVERLTLLREALVLANAYGAKLGMSSWIGDVLDEHLAGEDAEDMEGAVKCGTVCCNAGWAGLYPPIQELGLITEISKYEEDCALNGYCPQYHDEDDTDSSLSHLFNISQLESEVLFGSDQDTRSSGINEREKLVPGITEGQRYDYMTLEKSVQLVDALIARYQ